MGEARRRKQSDPNFGRVPKDAGYRGLVVSPPIEIEGSSLFVKSSVLDPQELRFSILFWDNLVWPSSRAIHIASGPDELFLESAGVLARPDYTVFGDGAQGIALGQINAFRDLDSAQPGVWALAQGENSLLLKGGLIEEGNGAMVELARAIPVPRQDVPLAEGLGPVKFVTALSEGWKLGKPYGLAAAASAAAVAGAASTLEIKGDFGLRSIRRPNSPYRYAFLAHEELR